MRASLPTPQLLTLNPTQNPYQLLIKLNSLLADLTRSHQYTQALNLFNQIHSSHHLKPDHYTLATTLTACANLHDTFSGNQLHTHLIHTGFKAYPHVANTLLSLYSKSHHLNFVKQLFDEIPTPDVYSWTTLLSAFTKSGQIDYAGHLFEQIPQKNVAVWNAMVTGCVGNGQHAFGFKMFRRMLECGVRPDHYTFASILSSCCSLELLVFGQQVHSLAIRSGFLVEVSVVNAHLTMYLNCGMVEEAYELFEEAKTMTCNQITFNAMVAGLVDLGRDEEALMIFSNMKETYYKPTEITYVILMAACSSARMGKLGQQIHSDAIKLGFEGFTSVSNATVNMYSNCGDSDGAYLVFESLEEKDLVSWNSILECYSQRQNCQLASAIYLQMQITRIKPDEFTIGSLLSCSDLGMTEIIQALIEKNGLISNIQVCNALVCAFNKHGRIERAYQVFAETSSRNVITWNSIISGCVLNGLPIQALKLFGDLHNSGIQPNLYALSIALSTCASVSALRSGKEVHGYILRSLSSTETSLGNALITMYAKCGVLDSSSKVFNGMVERDVISWNAMIAAYTQHGKGKKAICCFEAMKEENIVKPDHATFTSLLSACSHSGLVDEGRQIFSSMLKYHHLEPGMDQFSCIIDLLGRAGHLDEAESLIKAMPFRADSTIWWAVLSACIAHVNVRLGKVAAGFLIDTEPDSSTIYVLLSNLHAAAGQWEEATKVRDLMLKHRVMKKPGCSWI